MFYKNRIEKLECETTFLKSKTTVMNKFEEELANKIDYLEISNESYKKCITELQEVTSKKYEEYETKIKNINEKIEAIIECLRNDRKDINALINIYKNLNKTTTKRKK